MKYGLKQSNIDLINSVFEKFTEVDKVILYGSRAKGNFKLGSDIDLTIEGSNLDLTLLNKISWELDDLLLPYFIDLSILEKIENPDLIEHIHRVGKIFYEKTDSSF